MNIWEILGIEPTSDINEITAAFERYTEKYGDDPEKMKELITAYKAACEPPDSGGENTESTDEYSLESVGSFLSGADAELFDTNLYAYIFKKLTASIKENGIRSRNTWRSLELYNPEDGMTEEHRNFLSKCSNLLSLETFDRKTAEYIAPFFGVHGRAEQVKEGVWKITVSPYLKSEGEKKTPAESDIFRPLFEQPDKMTSYVGIGIIIILILFIGYFVHIILDSGLV